MRVVFVVNSMPDAAGVTTFCTGVLNGIVSQGGTVYLALNDDAWQKGCLGLSKDVRVVSVNWLVNSFVCDETTVVHINGLWNGVLNRACAWAQRVGAGVCWSPHGMLMPSALKVKQIKKYLAWYLYQRRYFKSASVVHATTQLEKDELRKFGIDGRIVTVPLGVDSKLYTEGGTKSDGILRRFLFVGRIDPIKGLASLIEAIANISQENGFRGKDGKEWRLRIIGPDNGGYREVLVKRCRDLGVEKFIEFIEPRFGGELIDEYLQSDAVVLPSVSENFGATILEGMAAGKPVITTKGTPWKCIEEAHCGFWVDGSPAALKEALASLMDLSVDARQEMGLRGRALAIREYDWKAISRKFMEIYEGMR